VKLMQTVMENAKKQRQQSDVTNHDLRSESNAEARLIVWCLAGVFIGMFLWAAFFWALASWAL
jgi:hypothetical protein